jgi:DNA-directed RNA polymerase subunit RPC12/RpoP
MCPSCRRELAEDDPVFCPHCGNKVAESESPLAGYEDEVTVPRQRRPAADPVAPGQGRRTSVMAGEADPDVSAAQFGPPRPATEPPTGPRPPARPIGVHRIPGTPVRIPISPRPARIVLGLALTGFAAWLLFAFLPDRRPLDDREVAELSRSLPAREVKALVAARLDHEFWVAGIAGSIALLCFGLFIAVHGAVYRAQGETICRKCGRQVIGWKRAFGLQCPLERHYAALNWALVVVTVLFWGVVLTLGGGMVLLLFA